MNWKVILFGEKVCSLLPFGYELVEFLKSKLTDTKFDYSKRIDYSLDNLALLRKIANFDIQNKTILEIGTGWHGIDLLIFYVLGAKAIYTFTKS